MLSTPDEPPSRAVCGGRCSWRCRIPAASLPVPARGATPAGGWHAHSHTPVKKHQNPLCFVLNLGSICFWSTGTQWWHSSFPCCHQSVADCAYPLGCGKHKGKEVRMLYTNILSILFTAYIFIFFLHHVFKGSSHEFYNLTTIPVAEDARKGLATTFIQGLKKRKPLLECGAVYFIRTLKAQRID